MLAPKETNSSSFPLSILAMICFPIELPALFNQLIEPALIIREELGIEILPATWVPVAKILLAVDVSSPILIESSSSLPDEW
ncbi:hypothetical protein GCM10009425_48010 [Pseudomonas asuensis]|uniref:Uncharacterized protein n=1 Tax=Pseudomonas asuensis TaxID=1825787 RepID=A0ABQ2H4Z9_9PSED|nr:hypothetical protein GCM10009425_48010 [Pseudomonas asuensis]